MNSLSRIAAAALVCLAGAVAFAQGTNLSEAESLVPVKARDVDKTWLLPGADFRPYRKVILKNAEVAFRKNWLRDVNGNSASLTGRVSPEDARRIVEDARSGFDETWAEIFKSAGYEVVAVPGDDVLEVTPRVVDFYVNAPAVPTSGILRSYASEAGEATLHMDVRESRTGTLLGRVSDRRQTARDPRPRLADGVTNRAQFDQLFTSWALIAVKALQDLKANSPLPEYLQPGQKVTPG